MLIWFTCFLKYVFVIFFVFCISITRKSVIFIKKSLSGNTDCKMQISFVVHVPSMLSNKSFSGNTDASSMQKVLISIFCASKKTKHQVEYGSAQEFWRSVKFRMNLWGHRFSKNANPFSFLKQKIYN